MYATRLSLGIAFVACLLFQTPQGQAQTAQAPEGNPQAVDVQLPIARTETIYATSSGRTSAFQRVDLMARVPGFLQEIGYKDGDTVKAGTALFTIEQAPYQASVASAEAGVASQQAQVTQTASDLARQTKLSSNQVVSAETLDDSKAQSAAAQAGLQQAQAALDQAKINLTYTTIAAPFDGVVTARTVDLGALVGASGPTVLATILQTDKLYVTFNATEQQVLQVRSSLDKRGQTLKDLGRIPVEVGLETDDGYPHSGYIDYVSPEIDAGTGTLTVRAVLDNQKSLLLPGLFVRVRVPVNRNVQALLVPETSLGNDQRGRYLLVVDEKGIVQQRPVTLGSVVDGGLVMITQGIAPEDRIVVRGLDRAIPGSVVTPTLLSASTTSE